MFFESNSILFKVEMNRHKTYSLPKYKYDKNILS